MESGEAPKPQGPSLGRNRGLPWAGCSLPVLGNERLPWGVSARGVTDRLQPVVRARCLPLSCLETLSLARRVGSAFGITRGESRVLVSQAHFGFFNPLLVTSGCPGDRSWSGGCKQPRRTP